MISLLIGTCTQSGQILTWLLLMAVLQTFMICPHYLVKLHYHALCFFDNLSGVGKQDQLKNIDPSLWAASMISESRSAPPLCPVNFKNAASEILRDTLHCSVADITHMNCRSVYLHLVHHIEMLVMDGTMRL